MINWRKGLFRLWIIIGTFWIISIGVFFFGEYNEAYKKESKIKQIVSEIKKHEKALQKIKEEFPEVMQQYQLSTLIPEDEFKKLSDEELLKLVKHDNETNIKEICKKAENDRRDKLYNIILLSITPPFLLLIIGSAIYWAFRGFRT